MPSEKQVIVDATSYTRAEGEGSAIEDPRAIIAREPMRRAQLVAVAICVALTALDGFDVLSISFASPGIAAEWGIDRAMLGIVLSMELIGMSVGSILVGSLADRVGRRPVTLGCLVVMATGMWLATTAHGVTTLSAFRLFTGLGIGGMLAAGNAMAAEFANARRRNLAVALMAAGYPLGAIVGGSIASRLLASGSWRSVFAFGALCSAAFIPIVWFLIPETVAYLAHRRPANVVERVNAVLRRLRARDGDCPSRTQRGRATRAARTALHSRARANDGAAHGRVLRAPHDLLLHPEVDPEDRRRHGLRAVDGRRRAGVGQRGRTRSAHSR